MHHGDVTGPRRGGRLDRHLALKLLHCLFCGTSLNKLTEAAALVSGHLGVDDVAKLTKNISKSVFIHISAQASDEDGGVCGVKI